MVEFIIRLFIPIVQLVKADVKRTTKLAKLIVRLQHLILKPA
jgi:hypothetical protein